MNGKYEALFVPFQFHNGVEVKNRVVLAPMTNFSAHDNGVVSDDEINYYIRRTKGVGLTITACANVTANGKGFPGEFGGHSEEMIPSLRRLAEAIKGGGGKAVLQIFHGGRECPPELVNGDVVSASAVASKRATPRALTESEVVEIIQAFGETTRRAIEAGFDGVEIHGANGYLIQQFFSPHANRREDRWGGSLEKRLAFPLAVVDEVKKVAAEHADDSFLIGYRFSPEEESTPGITMADTLHLVEALAEKELHYLHVSLMDFWSEPRRGVEGTKTRIAYLLDKINGRVPLIGVGSIRTADDAIKAIEAGVPLVALGRELIMDPDWVEKVQEGREAEIVTTLFIEEKENLVVPDPLWNIIIKTPGWFPIAQESK